MGTENMLNWAQAQSRADGCEPSHYRDIENPPEPIYGLFKAAAEAWRAVRHAAGNGAGIALSHPAVVVAEAAETAAWAAYEAAARELATAAETAGGVVEGEWIPPVNEGEAQSWGYTATRFGALLIAGVERQWALTAANGGGLSNGLLPGEQTVKKADIEWTPATVGGGIVHTNCAAYVSASARLRTELSVWVPAVQAAIATHLKWMEDWERRQREPASE